MGIAESKGHEEPTPRLELNPLFRPRSVAIVGMSSKEGTAGWMVLNNLLGGGYSGELHLVGRGGGEIMGRPVLTDVSQLPEGVDLAILPLPADAVLDTIRACIDRGVRSAVCFASGFAEMGEEGRSRQREIAEVARAGGMALLGPNTVGFFNYIDGVYVMMVELALPPRFDPANGPAVAVVAQSGGLSAHVAASLEGRGVPLSHVITTGNEAQLGLADMIRFFAADEHTRVIAVYAEQIRFPSEFIAAVQEARASGRSVVLLHSGRSEQSQEAVRSHTGALAGNYAAMRLMTEYARVTVVDSLEEMIDVSHLLLRYPEAPTGGLGLVTMSGAFCGVAQDYIEPLGLEMPPLAEEQAEALREHLPVYTPPRNPLDLGTLVGWKPELLRRGVAALLADPAVGSVVVSLPLPAPQTSVVWLTNFMEGAAGSSKPSILVMQNEDMPLAPEFIALARRNRVIVMRSPERALRALACATAFGRRRREVLEQPAEAAKSTGARLELGSGVQAEWVGKGVLRSLGMSTPPGELATSIDEAVAVAQRIGYPVVLKAQAAMLAHKSDAGGVLLNIRDEEALREAWQRLHDNIKRSDQSLKLDGVLVEAMGEQGLELVVGANRDPHWGPILMVGLGGIWVEALGDVQLLPANLPRAAIVERLRNLKASKLLDGFRGAPPVDVEAVADSVATVGRLMLDHPEITEIDINPLVAYGQGRGVMALDVLIVTE